MFTIQPKRKIQLTPTDILNIIKSEGYSCTFYNPEVGIVAEPLPSSLLEEFIEDGLFVSSLLGIQRVRISLYNNDSIDFRK